MDEGEDEGDEDAVYEFKGVYILNKFCSVLLCLLSLNFNC